VLAISRDWDTGNSSTSIVDALPILVAFICVHDRESDRNLNRVTKPQSPSTVQILDVREVRGGLWAIMR